MPRLQKYDDGLDCFADTYTALLSNLGADARILGDEWGYRYTESEDATGPSFMRLRVRSGTYSNAIHRWYGITERRVSHPTSAALWSYVHQTIDEGRYVVVQVDTYSYRHSLYYQRIHHVHRVVVTAYRDGELNVLDALPGRSFQGWMTVEEIDRAARSDVLAESFAGVGGAYCSVDLPRPGSLTKPSGADLRTALNANIDTYHASSARSLAPVGWSAAQRFLSDLREFTRTVSTIEERLLVQGVRLFGVLTKQRRQNAFFVELVGDRIGVDMSGVADELSQISGRLDRLRTFLFYGALARRPPAEHLARVADLLAEILDDEHECMRHMSELLREAPSAERSTL